MTTWTISNIDKTIKPIYSNSNFSVYTDNASLHEFSIDGETLFICITGYVLPRDGINIIKEGNAEILVSKLFSLYHFDFIKYIKGHFNILIIYKNKFRIYTDHIGIK